MVRVSPHLDDPRTTVRRQGKLAADGYLRRLYVHWYRLIIGALPAVRGDVLELGSGGGFLADLIPGLRTSDVMSLPGVDMQVDARSIPFPDSSLRAIVGTNVLHHVPQIERFFSEAERTLVAGGRLVFLEPWPTPLSRLVYRHLHHEPFDQTRDWISIPGPPQPTRIPEAPLNCFGVPLSCRCRILRVEALNGSGHCLGGCSNCYEQSSVLLTSWGCLR